MALRAPLLTSCSIQVNGWKFTVAKPLRSNPASQNQILAMYPKIQKEFGFRFKTFNNKEDIVSAAIEGLVQAAQSYEPSLGEWPIYARRKAENAVFDFLRKEGAGRQQAEAKTTLKSIKAAYRKKYPDALEPNVSQLAKFSGKTTEELHKLRAAAVEGYMVSTSAGVMGDNSDEDEATIEDTLRYEKGMSSEESAIVSQAQARRTELSDEAAYIGAYLDQGKSQAWIANKLNCSVSKVRALAKEYNTQKMKPK